MTLLPSQLSRHNKQLQHHLKPVQRIQEEATKAGIAEKEMQELFQ